MDLVSADSQKIDVHPPGIDQGLSEALNRIGEAAGEKYGVRYLMADFKKKNGYLRSLQLSKEYGLYRQDYCGCRYSMRETD